ncbi:MULTISPECIES: hypothetical protein [Cupriavidus]
MTDTLTPLQRQIVAAVAQGRKLCASTGGFEIHLGQTRSVQGGTVAIATRIRARTIQNLVEKGILQQGIGRESNGRTYPVYGLAAPPPPTCGAHTNE